MKDYTQTPTPNTQTPPPSSAGNGPDPCPFNVHICTCHERDKGVMKERGSHWGVFTVTGQTRNERESGERVVVSWGIGYLHLRLHTSCLFSNHDNSSKGLGYVI